MISFLLTLAVIIIWVTFAFIALTEPKAGSFRSNNDAIILFVHLTQQGFSRLIRLHPIFYVMVYIGQVIIFAVIYWLLPHRSFYHATAMYERGPFSEDAIQILSNIRHIIVESSIRVHGTSTVTLDGWTMDINSIQVYSIDVANFPEEVRFNIGTSIWYTFSNGELAYLTERAKVIIKIYGHRTISSNTVILPITIEEEPFPKIEGMSTKPRIDEFLMFGNSPLSKNLNHQRFLTIALPPDLYLLINSLGEGYRGFPSGVSGQLTRMLYFSAGIATSTAFGDIVPLTTIARILIVCQAIITILLVGFFLNAVGQSIAQA